MKLTCELRQPKLAATDFVRISSDSDYGSLNISFRRTIRVADNEDSNYLPPDLGPFPLHSVSDYSKLPASILEKGGFFLPLHGDEAMAICFGSSAPFAVRVLVGGFNALTGKESDDVEGWLEVDEKDSRKTWLDGFVESEELVRQFVAVRAGSGESYEAQKAGKDKDRTIRIEVMPRHVPKPQSFPTILIIPPRGEALAFRRIRIFPSTTVAQVKEMIGKKEDRPVDELRLIFRGKQLEDGSTLSGLGIENGSTVYLGTRLRGGGLPSLLDRPDLRIMSVAPGGLIRQRPHRAPRLSQVWNVHDAISFNISLINASKYQKITGHPPAPPAMSEAAYSAHGLIYFKTVEELAGHLRIPGTVNDRGHENALCGKIRSICDMRDILEPSHPIRVVKLEQTGDRTVTGSAFAEMLARAQAAETEE